MDFNEEFLFWNFRITLLFLFFGEFVDLTQHKAKEMFCLSASF